MRLDPRDVELCLGHGEDLAARGGSSSSRIVQTPLFAHPDTASLIAVLSDDFAGRVYGRGRNPTVEALEDRLAPEHAL
jgi:O-acetylhomoserine/O-acetylserine sulfhydrylase-like pyridoxal-dependent enzyme